MSGIETAKLGKSRAIVTRMGLGCAPIGDILDAISEEQAQKTFQAAWDEGVRYFDTSPWYGYGKSEHRLGTFLRQQPRAEFVVSTKVGRVLRAPRNPLTYDPTYMVGKVPHRWANPLPFEHRYDYTYEGIMRSYEDSLQRLSLPSVDLLVIHDLDFTLHMTEARVSVFLAQLSSGGWRALDELRSSGQIKGIGVGINDVVMIPRFLGLFDLDFILVGVAYTLLDQDLNHEAFTQLEERGVGVVIGAAFASGILATGPVEGARYCYDPAKPDILEKTRRIEAVCRRHNTPMPAAALQFPLAHPLVTAVIPGATAPDHVHANARLLQHPIPTELWRDLKAEGLLNKAAPTL